jgi:serine/threonine protein kinase
MLLTGTAQPASGGIGNQPTVPVAFPPPSAPGTPRLQAGMLIAKRYRLEALKGSGAMGEVWRARDEHLAGRPRALKRVLLGGATSQERAERESWLKREASILASLSHPAICDIFDVLEDGGTWYLILEWIEGRTLAEELAAQGRPGLPETEVLGWAATLCSALTLLHGQQPPIIFRDLKPQNIMIQIADRSVKLIDFGIARPVATRGATVIGTPGYAPPEQYQGTVDARADQYALAATLHHLLTGRDPTQAPPFTFPRVRTLVPTLSPAVEAALDRALSMKADDRFPTMADFAAALKAAQPSAPRPAPQPPAPRPAPKRQFTLLLPAGVLFVLLLALLASAAAHFSWFSAAATPTQTTAVLPVATSTDQPLITETALPLPTETALPLPTETALPLPTETALPLPTETSIAAVSRAHGYSIKYPASWTRKPHANNSDIAFQAPDTNALVIASATAGTATSAQIKAQQAKVLKGLGKAQGPLTYKLAGINGVTYQLSEIVTKNTSGKLLDVVLLDTVHGPYLYDFEALLLYNGPTYKAETKTVQQMLNSITLTK